MAREPGPVKGGTTVIAFVDDPTGYKWELIQRQPVPEPVAQVGGLGLRTQCSIVRRSQAAAVIQPGLRAEKHRMLVGQLCCMRETQQKAGGPAVHAVQSKVGPKHVPCSLM